MKIYGLFEITISDLQSGIRPVPCHFLRAFKTEEKALQLLKENAEVYEGVFETPYRVSIPEVKDKGICYPTSIFIKDVEVE